MLMVNMATENKADVENVPEKEDLLFQGHIKPYEKKSPSRCGCTKKKLIIVGIVVVMLLLYGLGLGIGLAIGLSNSDDDDDGHDPDMGNSSERQRTGAVVTDHEACSYVGKDILDRGGTAVDAAIAALLCNGVRTPHSMGIGGGCFMVVYDKATGEAVTFDGREIAPRGMTHEKYVELTKKSPTNPALYVGIPGELKAYELAYKRFGRIAWSELFQPAIKMADEGFPMARSTAEALAFFHKTITTRLKKNLTNYPQLCKIFCSDTTTGMPKKEGDMIYMPKLAKTLRGIAEEGPDYIYNSGVTRNLVEELNEAGGLFERFDFVIDYEVLEDKAMEFDIAGMKLYTMGGATGGAVVGLFNKVVEGFQFTADDISTVEKKAEAYHKMIETLKFVYADRAKLGDPAFDNVTEVLAKFQSPEYANYIHQRIDPDQTHDKRYYTDYTGSYKETTGTSHVSVLSSYGDAVSVTSTINYYFGRGLVSNSTGIIWNNEMDDFCEQPLYGKFCEDSSLPNRVQPNKRPLSSMSPVILVDKKGNVRMITGAAGGSHIATSTAQIVARLLWTGQPLPEAIDEKRFHHMLTDENTLYLEHGYPEDIKARLEDKGHKIAMRDEGRYMAVMETVLVDENKHVMAYADKRKIPGKASFVYH